MGNPSLFPGSSARHDELFRLLSIPTQRPEVRDAWMRFMEEIGQERAAIRDAQAIIEDYSEGRLDSIVALGKIGLRLLRVTG